MHRQKFIGAEKNLFFVKILMEFVKACGFEIGIDKAVNIAVHNGIDITCFKARSVVFDHFIRMEYV